MIDSGVVFTRSFLEVIMSTRIPAPRSLSRTILLLLIMIPAAGFLSGCNSNKIAVAKLEAVIEQSALAAKRAAKNDSIETLNIKVAVVTSTKGSAVIPIPYVPVGIEGSQAQTTELAVAVDLSKYPDEPGDPGFTVLDYANDPQVFILDLKTGEIEPVVD